MFSPWSITQFFLSDKKRKKKKKVLILVEKQDCSGISFLKNLLFITIYLRLNKTFTDYGSLHGFTSDSDGKESACSVGDPGLIPVWGRPPGEGNGYPLQYSCLENFMENSLVGYSPRICKELNMTERLTHAMTLSRLCKFLFRL